MGKPVFFFIEKNSGIRSLADDSHLISSPEGFKKASSRVRNTFLGSKNEWSRGILNEKLQITKEKKGMLVSSSDEQWITRAETIESEFRLLVVSKLFSFFARIYYIEISGRSRYLPRGKFQELIKSKTTRRSFWKENNTPRIREKSWSS